MTNMELIVCPQIMRIMMTEENNTISNSFLLDDDSRLQNGHRARHAGRTDIPIAEGSHVSYVLVKKSSRSCQAFWSQKLRLFFINMKMNLMLFKVLRCPAPILSAVGDFLDGLEAS
ncbi:hypothetical protein HanIR_Chr16g0792391 [Helianthus annuus]|nr:hypothetical protein HanIR_Chr16g0792391 [Helianthus annuus]